MFSQNMKIPTAKIKKKCSQTTLRTVTEIGNTVTIYENLAVFMDFLKWSNVKCFSHT